MHILPIKCIAKTIYNLFVCCDRQLLCRSYITIITSSSTTIVLTPYVLISQSEKRVRGFPTKPKMKEKSINGISFVYFELLGEEVQDEMIFYKPLITFWMLPLLNYYDVDDDTTEKWFRSKFSVLLIHLVLLFTFNMQQWKLTHI